MCYHTRSHYWTAATQSLVSSLWERASSAVASASSFSAHCRCSFASIAATRAALKAQLLRGSSVSNCAASRVSAASCSALLATAACSVAILRLCAASDTSFVRRADSAEGLVRGVLVRRSLCKLFAVTHRPQTEQPRARALPRQNSPEPHMRLVVCAA
jgi:hypothetical protein